MILGHFMVATDRNPGIQIGYARESWNKDRERWHTK